MESIDNLTKAFRFQYERFHLGCDAIEETGAWDKEKFGEMGAFYENDLLSSFDVKFKNGVECMKNINVKLAALYSELLGTICDILIASDGEISPDEIQEAQRIKSLLSDITSA